MDWEEDDFLSLSGLQHFSFCRRQWALIHIEQQWAENYRTTDGELLHRNAHNDQLQEKRGDLLVFRGMDVRSQRLGITGKCDVVEFYRSSEGVTLSGYTGQWMPFPIEYKRGKPSAHTHADELQLCAQALCLEEMLCCSIPKAALYYGETRHRASVELDDVLRKEVVTAVTEMHELYRRSHTPKVKPKKGCSSCSLHDLCLPQLIRAQPVSEYIKQHLEEKV